MCTRSIENVFATLHASYNLDDVFEAIDASDPELVHTALDAFFTETGGRSLLYSPVWTKIKFELMIIVQEIVRYEKSHRVFIRANLNELKRMCLLGEYLASVDIAEMTCFMRIY